MARNKKVRRSVGLRKTPRKPLGRTPKVTKPRLIEIREINGRRRRSNGPPKNRNRLRKLMRLDLAREDKPSKQQAILYPPISPSSPLASSSSSKLTAKRRRPPKPPTGDPIVIDSEDDNSVQETPLFYVDTTGGFNDKEIPRYRKNDADDLSVLLVETTLEEGEIREHDEGLLNKRINSEEIPISDEDSDDNEEDCMAPRRMHSEDQSVIFCSEVIDLVREDSVKPLDFIPIGFDAAGQNRRKRKRKVELGKKKSDKSANSTEQEENTIKRMVVIDGNNVAFAHTCGQTFSVKGLDICIQYFKKMGHEVKAVVPQFRLKKDKSTDQKLLEELYKNGDVLLAPSKNLPGQRSSSYDDRLIISVAEKFDGVVISNDNFRDLLTENDSWKKIIETRVVGYTWAIDAFFLPNDPYGRHGPKLKDLLEPKVTVLDNEK